MKWYVAKMDMRTGSPELVDAVSLGTKAEALEVAREWSQYLESGVEVAIGLGNPDDDWFPRLRS